MATYLEELIGLQRNPNAFTVLPIERTETGYSFPAMPTLAYDAIDAIINAATLPRDVYRGDRQPTIEDASNFALTFMGAGAPVTRPANSLGVGSARKGQAVGELPTTGVEAVKSFKRASGVPMEVPRGSPMSMSETSYKIPLSEMQATISVSPSDYVHQFNMLSPVDLYGKGNNVFVPFLGDRTGGGGLLTHVGGQKLDNPILRQGGYQYPQLSDNQIWASNSGVTGKLQNMAKNLGEEFEDVIGGHVLMRTTSGDQSHHTYELLLEQLKTAPIKRADIKKFNDEMKKKLPDFVGLKSPKLDEYLRKLDMTERTKFVQLLAQDKYQKLGFPNIEQTRFAVTDPQLIHAQSGSAGTMFAKMDKDGSVITDPSYVHKSYPTAITGEYLGGLEDLIPHNIMLRDWSKSRNIGDVLGTTDQKSLRQKAVYQPLDQQWLDETMAFLETLKKLGQ